LPLVKGGQVQFRDINLEPDALANHGATLEDIRKRLHATTAEGRMISGADVAIALWRITPGQKPLADFFGNPVLLPVTRFAYDRFADVLYSWNRRKGHW
jgi:predicted DCC family thiol-disulfide oxidoreductase YuxK